nr:hypothetical protein CFP56_60712 [Quercus suber]
MKGRSDPGDRRERCVSIRMRSAQIVEHWMENFRDTGSTSDTVCSANSYTDMMLGIVYRVLIATIVDESRRQ